MSIFAARTTIGLAFVFGAGSLLLLGLFLVLGPFGAVDLGFDPNGVLVWDAGLCVVFCLQHSLMVRRGFRERVSRYVQPPYYGALYSIVSGVALLGLVLLWQESPVGVLRLTGPARWLTRAIVVATIPAFLWGARSIPAFDPLGVGAIRARLRDRPPEQSPFVIRGPYRWVRHPQYLFSLVVFWSYPDLTADRLLFNVVLTVWVVLATLLEERDLVGAFGEDYRAYRRRVPMLLPWRGPSPER